MAVKDQGEIWCERADLQAILTITTKLDVFVSADSVMEGHSACKNPLIIPKHSLLGKPTQPGSIPQN